MGLLINGTWFDQWYDTSKTGGEFIREDSQFRNWIVDKADTPSDFTAESGRYHLYVSYACPWAHRTLIFRHLKQLEPHIGVSVVNPRMLENGWTYDATANGTADVINNFKFHYELYTQTDPQYSGRATVPVLWDKKTRKIVNNESAEIIRMFNSIFNRITGNIDDYYPEFLRDEIDDINDIVYKNINNGVYRAGFATSQKAYEKAVTNLFKTLDMLETLLSRQRYLAGDQITESDWRLFTTLIRFDTVYYGHFKTNLRRIEDYHHLSNYLRELYQFPGISDTVFFDHIKEHYFYSHHTINPTRIIPVGPLLDFSRQHDRADKPEQSMVISAADLEKQVEDVRIIKTKMLPPLDGEFARLKYHVYHRPLAGGGGDYFDIADLSDEIGVYGVLLADVSGHGVSAAVETAMLDAILRTYQLQGTKLTSDLVNYVNRFLFTREIRGNFITAFILDYEPDIRKINFTNAGHPAPLIKSAADLSVRQLTGNDGIPLCIDPDYKWTTDSMNLESGDNIIFYTDGLTEAKTAQGEQYGMERLLELLNDCKSMDPAIILQDIVGSLEQHTAGHVSNDDTTIITVQFL